MNVRHEMNFAVPAHVPEALVRPFVMEPVVEPNGCPYAAAQAGLPRELPIFWNPADQRRGGTWVVTGAEETRFVFGNPQLFTSKAQTGFAQLVGESWDMIPLELDPPHHTRFRQLLNPWLSPPAIRKMGAGIRERAVELIESFKDMGECEFVDAFGRPFPITITLQFMGLPLQNMSQYVEWEYGLLHSPDLGTRMEAAVQIRDHLRDVIAARREAPSDDFFSFIVHAEVDGKPLSDDEILGILYLLFVGGLDTVTSTLGIFFRHLAEHHDLQQRLRENPAMIPKTVEELLRRFSAPMPARQCVADTRIGDALIKAGDWVTCPLSFGSTDPREFDHPNKVDLDRKTPRHLAFGFGPHFCIGSHLARLELVIALEEWLTRIPMWQVKPGSTVESQTVAILSLTHLKLAW
jgi:cytochrome P450